MKKLTLISILMSASAFASVPISELGNYLNQSADQFESKLACDESDANYMHITRGVSIAFDIPEIFEVQVVPQFTLIWTKETEKH